MQSPTEIIIGRAATGKTNYILNKARELHQYNSDTKIAVISRSDKLKDHNPDIHIITPFDLANEARSLIEGSIWGHLHDTTWVSTTKIIDSLKPIMKKKGANHALIKDAIYFMIAAERNQWDDVEWRKHLYLWYGNNDSQVSELINDIDRFMYENNISLYPMMFNYMSQVLMGNEHILGYTHIMIDDAETIPRNELMFMINIGNQASYFAMTIDDKKKTYGWSEGTSESIVDIIRDNISSPVKIELDKNRGISWNINAICNHLCDKNTLILQDNIEPLKLYTSPNELIEAKRVINQVKNVRAKYPDREILITYRQRWFGRSILQEASAQSLIANVRVKGDNSYNQAIDLFCDYLIFTLNPMNGASLYNIMNKPSRRLGESTWVNMNALKEESEIVDWMDIMSSAFEVQGIRSDAIKAIGSLQNHIHNIEYLANEEISYYLLNEVKLQEYVIKTWGDEGKLAIMSLHHAAKTTGSIEECLNQLNKMRQSCNTNESKITIAPISEVLSDRFDYVWLVGIEDGIFPLANDITSYWCNINENNDMNTLYSIISRANHGVALWSAESRRINGRWKKTTLSPMIVDLSTMVQEPEPIRVGVG